MQLTGMNAGRHCKQHRRTADDKSLRHSLFVKLMTEATQQATTITLLLL
jgi:hypothetical protein